jgi:hypothetical protein
MVETENRMEPVNFTVDLERQGKLRSAAAITGIGQSELVRYMIDRLERELGDLENPNPKALKRVVTYCNRRRITKGTIPRGRPRTRTDDST